MTPVERDEIRETRRVFPCSLHDVAGTSPCSKTKKLTEGYCRSSSAYENFEIPQCRRSIKGPAG